jgi:hypothetical protein
MIAKEDPSAPWKIPRNLDDMGPLWKKKVLPSDWDIKHASLVHGDESRYVRDTYEWVQNSFNPDLTHHRLGITLAIMFSKMLPNIGTDLTQVDIPKNLTPDQVTEKIRQLPWIVPKHKGISQPEPFITMMSTAIIAILDENSPLRQYVKRNDSNALGNPWTDKHGESKVF